jgi:hypothetical protein
MVARRTLRLRGNGDVPPPSLRHHSRVSARVATSTRYILFQSFPKGVLVQSSRRLTWLVVSVLCHLVPFSCFIHSSFGGERALRARPALRVVLLCEWQRAGAYRRRSVFSPSLPHPIQQQHRHTWGCTRRRRCWGKRWESYTTDVRPSRTAAVLPYLRRGMHRGFSRGRAAAAREWCGSRCRAGVEADARVRKGVKAERI